MSLEASGGIPSCFLSHNKIEELLQVTVHSFSSNPTVDIEHVGTLYQRWHVVSPNACFNPVRITGI